MSARRVAALFRRLVEEIRRDRPSLALLFVAPIVITGLVTFILREGQTPSVDAVVVVPANPAGAASRARPAGHAHRQRRDGDDGTRRGGGNDADRERRGDRRRRDPG